MAEMVFNWSLGPLIIGSLLPPILLSFFVAATTRAETLSSTVNRFIDLCLYFVMHFKCPPQHFALFTQIMIAVIMLCVFLVTSVLQHEVISFSKRDRVPKSNCRYSRCVAPMASEVFGYANAYTPTNSAVLDFFSSTSATSMQQRNISACESNEKSTEAIFATSFLPNSELALLMSHAGLCGRRDILQMRTFSFKQQGLQVEENLELSDQLTQLCISKHIPWLERIIVEQGLFKYIHNAISHGQRVPEDKREVKFWNSDGRLFKSNRPLFMKKIRSLRRSLPILRGRARAAFGDNNMWGQETLAPWPLESLNIAFGDLLIGVCFSTALLFVEYLTCFVQSIARFWNPFQVHTLEVVDSEEVESPENRILESHPTDPSKTDVVA